MGKIKWRELTTKQFKTVVQAMMIVDDAFLDRVIVQIYKLQTNEEKDKSKSIEDNNVGFTKYDANVMSNIAEKIINGQELTKGERAKARNKAQKYWGQILMICRENWKKQDFAQKVEQINEVVTKDQKEDDEQRDCSENGRSCSYGICEECEKLAVDK